MLYTVPLYFLPEVAFRNFAMRFLIFPFGLTVFLSYKSTKLYFIIVLNPDVIATPFVYLSACAAVFIISCLLIGVPALTAWVIMRPIVSHLSVREWVRVCGAVYDTVEIASSIDDSLPYMLLFYFCDAASQAHFVRFVQSSQCLIPGSSPVSIQPQRNIDIMTSSRLDANWQTITWNFIIAYSLIIFQFSHNLPQRMRINNIIITWPRWCKS